MTEHPLSPSDPSRVNDQQERDIQYWTSRFHCTRAMLTDAVASVGNDPSQVESYLHILKGDKQGNTGL
jgi:hypothetical protein